MEKDDETVMMEALAADIIAERDAELVAVVRAHFIKNGLPDDSKLHRAYLSARFPDKPPSVTNAGMAYVSEGNNMIETIKQLAVGAALLTVGCLGLIVILLLALFVSSSVVATFGVAGLLIELILLIFIIAFFGGWYGEILSSVGK